ncbi:MAG TPA: patatin-like phospholipase family protein [Xanthomonadaceae bacterium]|nr:patatin-like phospholipase family protein [Xanthomonadaceae bacterium]
MEQDRTGIEHLKLDRDIEVGRSGDLRRTQQGRGLCLSGGGYRASLFHLGALYRLHQLGLLQDAQTVSAVSGGSIVAAWLMARFLALRESPQQCFATWCAGVDFRAEIVEPFREVVARDIRTFAVLRTLGRNWRNPSARVEHLERAYRRFLGDIVLDELPDTPRVVLCATNLSFGVNWEFSKERVGDYLSGYLRQSGSIPLARAVAASSSFPPVFGPVLVRASADDFERGRYRGDDADTLRAHIELSDGGVYDNLGLEPVLRRCREVLISDAGAPFAFVVGRNYLRRLLRYTQVIGNQAAALRRRLFFTLRRLGELEGAYWSLGANRDAGAFGYSEGLAEQVLARVRTDLDHFGDAEFEILVNHGYCSCEDGLREDGAPLRPLEPAPNWPYPQWAGEDAVRETLRNSHRRFLPSRWWRG